MVYIQTDEDLDIIEAMHKYGGSFVKALASAFDHADRDNFSILKGSFPKYWEEYRKMAEQDKR